MAWIWAPNVEPDHAGYEVWRALADWSDLADETPIARVPAGTTALVDPSVGCGQTARYRVRASDADGLESLLSDPLVIDSQDAGLRLSRGEGGLRLSWDPQSTEGFTELRVREIRSVRPDRELASSEVGAELALPELESGTELSVVFMRASAAGETESAPPCRLVVP